MNGVRTAHLADSEQVAKFFAGVGNVTSEDCQSLVSVKMVAFGYSFPRAGQTILIGWRGAAAARLCRASGAFAGWGKIGAAMTWADPVRDVSLSREIALSAI